MYNLRNGPIQNTIYRGPVRVLYQVLYFTDPFRGWENIYSHNLKYRYCVTCSRDTQSLRACDLWTKTVVVDINGECTSSFNDKQRWMEGLNQYENYWEGVVSDVDRVLWRRGLETGGDILMHKWLPL